MVRRFVAIAGVGVDRAGAGALATVMAKSRTHSVYSAGAWLHIGTIPYVDDQNY